MRGRYPVITDLTKAIYKDNTITVYFNGPIGQQELDFINANPLKIPVPDLVGESEYSLTVDVYAKTTGGEDLANLPVKVYLQ